MVFDELTMKFNSNSTSSLIQVEFVEFVEFRFLVECVLVEYTQHIYNLLILLRNSTNSTFSTQLRLGMIVDGTDYKTKRAAQEHAKAILNGVKLNSPLSQHDFDFMMDWFAQTHEEPERKFGAGVKSIHVRMNYQHSRRGVRGFWLVRVDGTETDISYLPKRTQYGKVLGALREAVKPTIEAFRATNNMEAGEHVDHAGDWPFSRIVSEFERQLGRKIETLKLKPHDDGDMVNELADSNIAARFKAWHDSVCFLQALDAKENIAKGDKIISEVNNERLHTLREQERVRQEGQMQKLQEARQDIQPRRIDEYYQKINPRKPGDLEDKKDYVLGSEFAVWLMAAKLRWDNPDALYDELARQGHTFIKRESKARAVCNSIDYLSLEKKLVLNGTDEKWASVKARMLA